MGLAGVIAGSATRHGPYRPNELATELGPAYVRTLGCIDLGVRVLQRGPKGEHLDVRLGNRCAHPEAIDLKKTAITAQDLEDEPMTVILYDPRDEIDPLHVGAAEQGREIIRLFKDGDKALGRICFDFKAVAPDAPEARPEPLCIVRQQFVPDVKKS